MGKFSWPVFSKENILFPAMLLFVGVFSFIVYAGVLTYSYFYPYLDARNSLLQHNDSGFVLYDRNGIPFFSFGNAKIKTYIPFSKIPKYLDEAVITSEDRDFYKHKGISFKAVVRAMATDILNRNFNYGASTLTQQLVKNSLLKPDKKIMRKFQEVILATYLEKKYSKNEILEMYLNSVYFGEGAYGVEEAALTYFGENVWDINLTQATYLASILPAPSVYDLFNGDPDKINSRRKYILENMYREKLINAEEEKASLAESISFTRKEKRLNTVAPHFALMVRDFLVSKYGEAIYNSGDKIFTTLDLSEQVKAEQKVKSQVENLRPHGVTNGAAVAIDPLNGEVRVLVGSYDWYDPELGKVNMADMPRQPGSSFKPIVYSLALDRQIITPATILKDEPVTFKTNTGNYSPHDFDGKFRGFVSVRRALANSLNVPAVEVMSKVGVESVLETAKNFGISTLGDPSHYGLSLVLGSGEVKLIELTDAYATFANGGIYNPPVLITKITDKKDNEIFRVKAVNQRVIRPEVAFLISSILSDAKSRHEEFGNALDIPKTAAVKTGTTDSFRDAWTLGYTPDLAVGVWIGNNNNKPMDGIAGSLGAAPIWKELMENFLTGLPDKKFEIPQNVIRLSVCGYNGLLAVEATSSARDEYFISGTQPTRTCSYTPVSLINTAGSYPSVQNLNFRDTGKSSGEGSRISGG